MRDETKPGPLSEPIATITHHELRNVGVPDGEETDFYSLDFVHAGDYDYLDEAEAALAKHIAIVQGGAAICQACMASSAAEHPRPDLSKLRALADRMARPRGVGPDPSVIESWVREFREALAEIEGKP